MNKEDEKLYRLVDELEQAEKRTEGGEAILYLAKKIAERTKREVIEKATEWLKEKCCSFWIEDFKQAMEDEREDI